MSGRRARWRRWRRLVLTLVAGLAAPLGAQQPGAYDSQAAPYETANAGVDQSVARISYLNGNVSYSRGDDPDHWQDADVNVPMTIGDRVYTGEGSLELQLERGVLVDLGARTDLAALNLTPGVSQFAVKVGVGTFAVPRLAPGEVFEVDTPNSAITLDQPGRYRVDVDESGQTRVIVRHGAATVAAGGGQLDVGDGEAIVIDGIDMPRYEVVATPPIDRWDSWAESRQERELRAASIRYVSPGVVGAADLDAYGTWENVPQYGRVWTPASVQAGWEPYREGHWTWQDPWGWTWISTEPWGWAPYHYGRWVTYSQRWYWVPVAPAVATVSYSPALVAFVGGPAVGVGVSVSAGPSFVGWFPLAPSDPMVPWWGPRAYEAPVNVTNVTYVNRTYVTVVNQQTFVSGGLVAPAVVRESATVRQVAAAPVVVGRVPVAPTVASTRVSVRQTAAPAPRPPAAVVQRAVVTRAAPPPAPPRFDQKLAVIRENKAPVAPQVAARIAPNAAKPVVAVRPVAAEGGNVRLAPRQTAGTPQKKVEPVTASTAPGRRVAPAPGQAQAPPTPLPARPQPGSEPRPAESSVERPLVRPTAPAPIRRPDEPALAAPGAERNPERPAPESQRETLRPTPSRIHPTPGANPNGANPNWRERENPPREREAVPPAAAQPRNEAAPQRNPELRPTPAYMNPNRRPTASPERRAAPPQAEHAPREGVRPTPPARVNPDREPAPPERQRAAAPESSTREGPPPERGKAEQSPHGRRPTPHPTPRPD